MATTKAKATKASGKAGKLSGGFEIPKAPKRTPVDEKAERRFVETKAKPAAVPATATSSTSRLRRDERGERLSVYLPPELAEALRVHCARSRRSVSDAVTEAVRGLLQA